MMIVLKIRLNKYSFIDNTLSVKRNNWKYDYYGLNIITYKGSNYQI